MTRTNIRHDLCRDRRHDRPRDRPRRFERLSTAALCSLLCSDFLLAHADDGSLTDALRASQPLLDARARYEYVDQAGIPETANAGTLRVRFGGETGSFLHTSLLAEAEVMQPLDRAYRPDNAVATYTQYPVVPDPENHSINRLQLTNTSLPDTTLTLGRQRIQLDDERFVGNSGWRQNEVTFDAVRLVNTSAANVTIDLTFLDKVHRVYGADSPQGSYRGPSYLANVAYQGPFGKLTGFAYLLEFDPIPGLTGALDPSRASSSTEGARLTGERALGSMTIGYALSYAWQRPRGDNPLSFTNEYSLAEIHATVSGLTLAAGDENMHGNGIIGFATPLGTVHLFDGWADKFLTTPANGLDDRYGTLTATAKHFAGLDMLSASAVFRDFQSQRLGAAYGHEWDCAITGRWRHYTGLLQYANYTAAVDSPAAPARDTRKLWAQLQYVW